MAVALSVQLLVPFATSAAPANLLDATLVQPVTRYAQSPYYVDFRGFDSSTILNVKGWNSQAHR